MYRLRILKTNRTSSTEGLLWNTVHLIHCTSDTLYIWYTVRLIHCTSYTLYILYTVHLIHCTSLEPTGRTVRDIRSTCPHGAQSRPQVCTPPQTGHTVLIVPQPGSHDGRNPFITDSSAVYEVTECLYSCKYLELRLQE